MTNGMNEQNMPPYSPDFARIYFYTSRSLKKYLKSRRFVTDNDDCQAVLACLRGLNVDFFYGDINALELFEQML